MVPILAMILSLVAMIRRVELSLSPGHPTLLLYCAGLGAALTHCVLLAAASKETVAAFLFVASTAMQASPYPSTSPSPSPNPNPIPNHAGRAGVHVLHPLRRRPRGDARDAPAARKLVEIAR